MLSAANKPLMLSVIMLNVIMLSALAPEHDLCSDFITFLERPNINFK